MQSHVANGPQNGLGTHDKQLPIQDSITRPFTLQEALPFSPQTSTVPFISDIIPDPSLGSGSPALPVTELFPTDEFDGLNTESLNHGQLSKSAKQAVENALHDLKTNQRTQYKFRALPQQFPMARGRPRRNLAQGLSPITKAVYDRVGSFFKATKPNGPDPVVNGNGNCGDVAKLKQESSPYPAPQSLPPHLNAAKNEEAHRLNEAKVEVALTLGNDFNRSAYVDVAESTSPPSGLVSGASQAQAPAPGVPFHTESKEFITANGVAKRQELFIELTSGSLNRDEYLTIAEAPDAPDTLSARKKGGNKLSDGPGLVGESLDQRQRGEGAIDALQKLMSSIFSSVSSVLALESGHDHVITLSADQQPTMTAGTQQRVHAALLKVISLHSFDKVPLETLINILKLSEGSLASADDMSLRLDEHSDEGAVESWVGRLSELEQTLKAARTSLRILTGGREDKQLYAEEMIQRCVTLFKNAMEDLVIPMVELRSSGSSNDVFKLLSKHKKAVGAIFVSCQKLFGVLTELVGKIELSESVLNTLEFTASRLIFVENAHFERDSAVGAQKFDPIRSIAMDMLCQIFLIKPEQRQGIIDDVLTSLEKLPVGRQSSRQFKLAEGGSIQPVSALIMRLVQASSGRVDTAKEQGRTALMRNINGVSDGDDDDGAQAKPERALSSIKSEDQGAFQHAVAIQDLDMVTTPLSDAAQRNASYVINFIVKRAMRSTKSGDAPYRNLLDLFVEDFTLCLDSPDWPSAELLLRLLMLMMVQLFEAPKTAAPSKNMALELLGGMSAAISRLRSHVKKTANSFEGGDADELSRYLAELAHHVLEQKSQVEHIVAWSGPYRTTLEYLQSRYSDDQHLSSALSFLVTNWAARVHMGYDSLEDSDQARDQEFGRLAYRLRMMIEDRNWLVNEYTFKSVSAIQARLAYSVILLRSPLCESFNRILNILLGSMASEQATVRSKSLKSVSQVLETDPSILDGESTVIHLILECSNDSSIQVRDSALGLLGNCIGMRPGLEESLTPRIIERFQDAGVGVRKRAMKLARDIYLRNKNKKLRSAIANGLLRRMQDPDEGVKDLSRQMIEEIWFAPFYHSETTATFETSFSDHVALIIQTVKNGTVTEILDKVFQTILRPQGKSLEGPFAVCSKLVTNMFGLMDSGDPEDPSLPSGKDALQVLTIFAKADPKLFSFEQVRLLKPQLASYSGADELAAFRAVTVIYRRVLPLVSTVHKDFFAEVRLQLLKAIGKISSRGALDDLIACAKVVCDLLKSFAPLANLVVSSLMGIQKLRGPGTLDEKRISHLSAYSIIVGNVAKHCDLDQQIPIFKAKFPSWQGDSVPRLIVDILIPFASTSQPSDARKSAIEAVGLVCQSWPRNYVIAKVYTAFQQVFDEDNPVLETMVLRSFKEFLLIEERRSEAANEAGGPEKEKKKELTVMGGTSFDDVASATTQRFLHHITRIALATQDELAFLAMEVLGSINRQGLTHPKETGVALMTLETSANRKIAELAFSEHRSLHEKHETVLEREYVKAVQSAYAYQRDVVHDSHGASSDTYQPKLHLLMEVLKISKMKNRQRFLEKLLTQVDFDLSTLSVSEAFPAHVDYSRFIIENVAFFEYQTVGELQTAVSAMEKMVTATGATVAQAIESEVFNVRMDADGNLGKLTPDPPPADGSEMPEAPPKPMVPEIEPGRLRQLTAGAMILLSIWDARTHLRRLYGMGTGRHDSKAKALAKDLNKTPNKVQGVHGERFWEEVNSHMNALESQEQMMQACKAVVELLNVDKELKVSREGEMDMDDPATPSGEEDEEAVEGDRGRKRKGGSTPGGRKKRARSSSRARGRPRASKLSADGDEDFDADGDFEEDWI